MKKLLCSGASSINNNNNKMPWAYSGSSYGLFQVLPRHVICKNYLWEEKTFLYNLYTSPKQEALWSNERLVTAG